jgi:macrolide transport system ATP-binding/permease protein
VKAFFRKLAWLAHRRDKEAELRAELEFHLGEEADERMSDGRSPAEAQMAARRELGNVTRVSEEMRAAWGWTLAEQFVQDLRYALRNMTSNKAFSVLAILSLALGIGANTAIFSFMDSILLRSLPVDHPGRLVILSFWTKENEVHGMNLHDDSFLPAKTGYGDSVFSYAAFAMFQSNKRVFSDVFGYQGAGDLHFAAGDRAEIARTEYVTGNYFQALGFLPLRDASL